MVWDDLALAPWGRALVGAGALALWSALWLSLERRGLWRGKPASLWKAGTGALLSLTLALDEGRGAGLSLPALALLALSTGPDREDPDSGEGVRRSLLTPFLRRLWRRGGRVPTVLPEDDLLPSTPPKRAQTLRFFIRSKLADTFFVVASHTEPFIHAFEGKSIRWSSPASGVVTALDPLMRTLGGVWVSYGGGSADREVTDAQGRVAVPPNAPQYTLRRVWLTPEQIEGYYTGFANQTLWPLCHTVYIRPRFDASFWRAYREVNEQFARAILEEVQGRPALVFVQDYHLALVPRLLKESGAEVAVAQFWHIPWPPSEVFSTCPWAEEVLEGLLGNDLLGFQTFSFCTNFLDTVNRLLEARVDHARSCVVRGGRQTLVRPFPIGIDFEAISRGVASAPVQREAGRLREEWGMTGEARIGLGVERLDYTKGILERLQALDLFFQRYPHYRERFTFVQVGVPTRLQIPHYQEVNRQVQEMVQEINQRHGTGSWRPILFFRRYFPRTRLWALYSLADLCIVSPQHDGMNLVAKEYVAARNDQRGVLLLSKFTGAAQELTDALLVNPYDTERFADLIARALDMPAPEQALRMRRMRAVVQENDIYTWARRILAELARLSAPAATSARPRTRGAGDTGGRGLTNDQQEGG